MTILPRGEPRPERSPASTNEPTLRRLVADDDHRLALFGPLLLSVWIGVTRIDALCVMERLIEESARDAPEGRLGLFVVVEPHATAPSSAARDELARIRRTNSIGLTALVYEGDGFGAALVRGITTGLNLLERGRSRTHIFADVATAARWVETTTPGYGGGSELETAVHTLRASQV